MRNIWLAAALGVGLVAGATAAPPQAPRVSESEARAAATRAIALLQQSMATWEAKRTCGSCHHLLLPIALLRTARQRDVAFDEALARASVARLEGVVTNLDFAVQAIEQIDPSMDTGSSLGALADAGIAPSLSTEVFARRLVNRQQPDGRWITIDVRPPQSFSQVTATAVSLRAIASHLPASDMDRRRSVERASKWLEAAAPADTEDRTFQLLGLSWAGAAPAALSRQVSALLATQRADGGWSQLSRLPADAYATGQALVALMRAGGLPAAHPAVSRGLAYLLSTQQRDGSWLVATRLHEQDLVSPPYFETGFPHGPDQISSAMGTAWAAMALLESLPARTPEATVFPRRAVQTPGEKPWMRTALFGTASELAALLDGGLDVNSRTAGGTTVLMMAAHDADKVRLLLRRGANVSALSEQRHDALMVSANHVGSLSAMRLLLDAGASPGGTPSPPGSLKHFSPMLYAIWSGEPAKVIELFDSGAKLPRRMSLLGGELSVAPIELAIFQRDQAMVRLLAARGADVAELSEFGISPLIQAVLTNDAGLVRTLVELGADVDQVDQNGETALMHAALVDFGDSGVIETLLALGARRDPADPTGRTALALARQFGHAEHVRRLQ